MAPDQRGPVEHLWLQPAAGDAGGALGVALAVAQAQARGPRRLSGSMDGMKGAYLGPAYGKETADSVLAAHGARSHDLAEEDLLDATADALAEEKVVGWFQGRMEFGPRALGNRSILGDVRSPRMQKLLNMKIKYRESFRSFAPAVLRDRAVAYFDLDVDSPYMLLIGHLKPERRRELTEAERALKGITRLDVPNSDIPAVTHVDHSGRIQTVHQETNPRFHGLLERFQDRTGCGVLVNTSFNIRDEPIVCTPEDAYRCFMATEMDLLVLNNTVLFKDEQ